MKPEAFHPFARLLHWLMAVLILAMLFIGVSMVADLSLRHPVLIGLHKATGLALLVLVVLRIGVRLAVPHPPCRETCPPAALGRRGIAPAALWPDASHAATGLGNAVSGRLPSPAGLAGHRPAQLATVCRAAHGTRLGRLPAVRHRAGACGGSLDARMGAPRRCVA